MGRRLLFVLGLVGAVYGGWLVHHEGHINTLCNAEAANPSSGFSVSPQCLNIVWPYAEGFLLLIAGAIFVFAALIWSRRVMAGERRYLKDVRAGKFDRENDHMNSYNFTLKIPVNRSSPSSGGRLREPPAHE
jgi:hypothetical protein